MKHRPERMRTLPQSLSLPTPPICRRRGAVAAGLAFALALAACGGAARAGEPAAEAEARSLADAVMERAGAPHGLGEWTRSVVEHALERAGAAASGAGTGAGPSPAPLPAERQAPRTAAGLAAHGHGAEVIVFMSLAVPVPSWRAWARDAARAGAPLVLRGVSDAGLRATTQAVGERLGGAQAGVAIDPRLFRLFGVERVPAVAVVPGGVPACRSRGCAGDAPPPFDLVTGNIGLGAALDAIGAEGSAGRGAARRALARLRGDTE